MCREYSCRIKGKETEHIPIVKKKQAESNEGFSLFH